MICGELQEERRLTDDQVRHYRNFMDTQVDSISLWRRPKAAPVWVTLLT